MNIKNDNYIQISGWMINELDLKGNELLVYALIHGFCQDGKSVFKGSLNYIMSWLKISKPTCITTIQSLIDKGLIVKTVIYNKNSVAGCEYYTNKSRNTESTASTQSNNLQSKSKNIEKGGKETLPPQTKNETEGGKNILPPQNEGGKETLLGWSKNFTRGGKETLPNNTTGNTKDNATAANKTNFEALSEKYFGKNAFDAEFARKAAAFFKKTQIKDYELYFDFIKTRLTETQNAKQVKNPRGLAYRLFFQPDIAQSFLEQQQNILLEKQKEEEKQRKIEERKLLCPCCGKKFLPDYVSSCPECSFAIDNFDNQEKVNVHIRFLKLPDAKKEEYQKEINNIYFSDNFLETFRETPEQRKQKSILREQQERELNIKYGLVG